MRINRKFDSANSFIFATLQTSCLAEKKELYEEIKSRCWVDDEEFHHKNEMVEILMNYFLEGDSISRDIDQLLSKLEEEIKKGNISKEDGIRMALWMPDVLCFLPEIGAIEAKILFEEWGTTREQKRRIMFRLNVNNLTPDEELALHMIMALDPSNGEEKWKKGAIKKLEEIDKTGILVGIGLDRLRMAISYNPHALKYLSSINDVPGLQRFAESSQKTIGKMQ